MRLRTILTATAAAVLAIGTAVVTAPSASAQGAPIIWYQAVAVSSASSPCPVTSDAEKTAGWTDWTGSWAEWPNDGKGGNVCTRSITWAYEADTARGGAGCIYAGQALSTDYWAQFGGGWSLIHGTPVYSNSTCTPPPGNAFLTFDTVYAPNGNQEALCQAAWGQHAFLAFGDHLWGCANPA